jgi:hypothetical protein
MNDSIARVFGNVLIAGALVLVVLGLSAEDVATAVIGVGLLVGGCLLRIEAAIVRGQPAADPAQTGRRPDSEVLHLPERTGYARPWHGPEGRDGPEPIR